MAEMLSGTQLILQNGKQVDAGSFLKNKVVALYFSASWCPPCRSFTPKLKVFYEGLKEKNLNFEVVFVSRDPTEEDLLEYFNQHHGDWAAIPFEHPKLDELREKYEVKGIPTLIVITPSGEEVTRDARWQVDQDDDAPPVAPEAIFDEWKKAQK